MMGVFGFILQVVRFLKETLLEKIEVFDKPFRITYERNEPLWICLVVKKETN